MILPKRIAFERAWKLLLYPVQEQRSFKAKLKFPAIWMRELTTNTVKSFREATNASFDGFIINKSRA